LLPWRIALPAE
ncbi:outer membrane autotransporter barrel domain protein, partial [Escherichia coli 95.0183]